MTGVFNPPPVFLVKPTSFGVLHKALQASGSSDPLQSLGEQTLPQSYSLMIRIDKEMMDKVVLNPNRDEPNRFRIECRNENDFTLGLFVKINYLKKVWRHPMEGVLTAFQKDSRQFISVVCLEGANSQHGYESNINESGGQYTAPRFLDAEQIGEGVSLARRASMKNHFLLFPVLAAWALSLCSAHAETSNPLPPNLAPGPALQELKDGNQRFVQGSANSCAGATFTRTQLANGQAPNTAILSCSDSRVPPEQVFDQELGQLFVVRVAGNVLNPDAIASMEYAVTVLGTRLILVLGHESCGAVKAAIDTPAGTDAGSASLNALLSEIRVNLGNVNSSTDPKLRAPVMKNVSSVANELLQRSPIIASEVAAGQVQIQEGIYALDTGMVDFWSGSPAS